MTNKNLKKLLKKSREKLNVDCSSCSNCNGRQCGRIQVKLTLTHEEYKDIFGQQVHSQLLTVNNLPMDRKRAIEKVVNVA